MYDEYMLMSYKSNKHFYEISIGAPLIRELIFYKFKFVERKCYDLPIVLCYYNSSNNCKLQDNFFSKLIKTYFRWTMTVERSLVLPLLNFYLSVL